MLSIYLSKSASNAVNLPQAVNLPHSIKLPKVVELPKPSTTTRAKPISVQNKCGYSFDTNHIAASPPGGMFINNLNKRMQLLHA
jgi:hypothetical protein